jgi:hypothetical protein
MMKLAAILAPSLTVLDELRQVYATDHVLQDVMKQVLDDEKGAHWQIIDDLITVHG